MEFVEVNSWFDAYRDRSSERFWTFRAALNLFKQREGKVIVETGTTRLANDWGAGMSTVLFGEFCKRYGGKIYTVDIDPANIATCKVVTQAYQEWLSYHVDDSLHFLKDFKDTIDLLYLDSLDFPIDGSDPTPCQLHQLQEFKLVEKQLHDWSIVLLDDNNFPTGGKAKLTKHYLAERGWQCVLDSQQSLFIKG